MIVDCGTESANFFAGEMDQNRFSTLYLFVITTSWQHYVIKAVIQLVKAASICNEAALKKFGSVSANQFRCMDYERLGSIASSYLLFNARTQDLEFHLLIIR